MNLIETKILDKQFTKLIRKSLGYNEGSIISPILSNIYLHQLDGEIQILKDRFDRGTRPRANREYQRIGVTEERFNYTDPVFNYVRYADN